MFLLKIRLLQDLNRNEPHSCRTSGQEQLFCKSRGKTSLFFKQQKNEIMVQLAHQHWLSTLFELVDVLANVCPT